MRRINEKLYEVWTIGEGTDDYGQRVPIEETTRQVRANIATQSQMVFEEEAQFAITYYAGLTWERGLRVGQQLRNGEDKFKITSVNDDARQTQLILELV